MLVKVSIIIPTYKRGDSLLDRAIQSALQQTHPNIEVVVVDDNPALPEHRLQTEQIMAPYAADARIVFLQNEQNLGGAGSRNVGIERATGDYITFLDDDDVYLPEKVAAQLAYMETNDLDMSFTDLRIHGMDERLIDYRQFASIRNFTPAALFRYHLLHHITGTPTFMYRSEAMRRIGGFDVVPMGQEFYLMVKTIRAELKVGYFNQCHVIAYIHDGEKISSGPGKLKGERALYEFKKQQFKQFSWRERMYMKSRHHAVMALAQRRSGQTMAAVRELLLAVIASPWAAFSEMIRYFRRLRSK